MSYSHELIYPRNNYYENVQFCEFDVFSFTLRSLHLHYLRIWL